MSEVNKSKGTKNTLLIVVIVLLVLVIVGGGAFAGYYLASGNGNKSIEQAAAKPVVEATIVTEEFLLNLADTDSRRFIKTKIVLAYDQKNKKLAKELESKKAQLNDPIIRVLRSKKAAEITQKGAEDLKAEMLNSINSILTSGKLTNIYYNSILVQ
jgi:flagellar protein FliL